MNLEKYKWKSRILLVSMPNYKARIYLEAKKIYQDKIKDFHKRYVKLICKINKKENLPSKICIVCKRPFIWSKKWKLNWEKVRYCSKRCSSKKV